MTDEEVARVAHEANRALTYVVKDVPVQASWDEIDADMRASCIKGVQFALANPYATPEQMHEEWRRERYQQGWVLGEKKDSAAKTHPALRPYADLPYGTRKKDAVFRAIVQALR